MDGGLQACQASAIDAALLKVSKKAVRLLRGLERADVESLAEEAAKCHATAAPRGKARDLGNGQCEVTVRLAVDMGRLEQMVRYGGDCDDPLRQQQASTPIGVVLRYSVDGHVVAVTPELVKSGYRPLVPIQALESEFARQGYQTYDLLPLHDNFAERVTRACPVNGGGSYEHCKSFQGFAKSVGNVLQQIWESRELAKSKEGRNDPLLQSVAKFWDSDGWVLIGDVQAFRRGQSVRTTDYESDVSAEIRLINLNSRQVIAGPVFLQPGSQRSQLGAVVDALTGAAGLTTEEIVRLLRRQKN